MLSKIIGGLMTGMFVVACGAGDPGMGDEEEMESIEQGLRKPLGTNGDGDYCNDPANPCAVGEGDCDSHAQCTTGFCGANNGPKFGQAAGADVCTLPHCQNRRRDLDETGVDCGGASCGACPVTCPVPNGGAGSCTPACPCASGQGDCNANSDCQPGLVCGRNNGARFSLPAGADVCVAPHCQNRRIDAGETSIDCGGECGSGGCPNAGPGCLGDATYAITVNGLFEYTEPHLCSWRTVENYRHIVGVSVMNGAVQVTGDSYLQQDEFTGAYTVTTNTSTGWTAERNTECLPDYLFDVGCDGTRRVQFDCATGVIRFDFDGFGDVSDGCPDFTYGEAASGSWPR